jgi:hypothetical protein
MYGQGVTALRTVKRSTKVLTEERTALNHSPKPRRPPRNDQTRAAKQIIDDNPFCSHNRITQRLTIHRDVVKRILTHELGLRNINFRSIPHLLTTDQKAARVTISRQLPTFLARCSEQNLCDFFTGDETWISTDRQRSSMWASADTERPTRVRRAVSKKKFIFWICFSRTGGFNVVAPPPGERFARDFFVHKVMDNFIRIWSKKRPTNQAAERLECHRHYQTV